MEILLVDDEPELRATIADVLEQAGHMVTQLAEGGGALALLAKGTFDVLISDVRLPGVDGLTLANSARTAAPLMDCILITGCGDVRDAVAALKAGAVDYLTKPFDLDELLHQISRIEAARAMRRELAEARRALSTQAEGVRLVGHSILIDKVRSRIQTVAPSDAPILIVGESGTGKELVAHMLHEGSSRAGNPFVAVNCAAFPDTLIESELFGFERGAFTGAGKRRDGRFRAAHGGTLFLDEIAELPLPAQAKLLRVLQDGTFEPLGTDAPITVDVRIVTATHRDLREQVANGRFREDLFFRVNVIDIRLPPLRERDGDLPLLVEFFLGGHAKADASGRPVRPTLSEDAYGALAAYPFPGNVRELGHAIEHAAVLAGGREITLDHLPAHIADAAPHRSVRVPAPIASHPSAESLLPLSEATRAFEKRHVRRALEATGGKRVKAAERLGISRKCLWEKLRRYELEDGVASPSHSRTL
jgi:two-component system, NtrC family, response regulator HydG